MSKKGTTKPNATTTTTKAKRPVGRPRKKPGTIDPRTAPEASIRLKPSTKRRIEEFNAVVRSDKARIISVTEAPEVPKSVKPLVAAKTKKAVPKAVKRPGNTKAVTPHVLNEAYQEYKKLAALQQDQVKELKSELKEVRDDLRTTQRALSKLKEIIEADSGSAKKSVWPWRRG